MVSPWVNMDRENCAEEMMDIRLDAHAYGLLVTVLGSRRICIVCIMV